MKQNWDHLEGYRRRGGLFATATGTRYGQFEIDYKGATLCCIATEGDPQNELTHAPGDTTGRWEHVSAHARTPEISGGVRKRTPTWEEMHYLKTLFWGDEEAVMQLHPPASEYVNVHDHVLHLWRPLDCAIPQPPTICV